MNEVIVEQAVKIYLTDQFSSSTRNTATLLETGRILGCVSCFLLLHSCEKLESFPGIIFNFTPALFVV